jgi:ferredoxin
MPIASAIKESHIELPYERIGFVFPTYYVSAPPIIKRFVEKLHFEPHHYIFAAVTAGGATGRSFLNLGDAVAASGGILSVGYSVLMPGNNISGFSKWPDSIIRFELKRAKKKAVRIADAVKNKKVTPVRKGNLFFMPKAGFISTMHDYEKYAKNFSVSEKCTGCRTCKKICPTNNIEMVNRKPNWGELCEHCLACIQWCPVKAIDLAGKTSKRKQYRNPEVKVKDLFVE